MALPGISVAMATYNGERHISEQLESLSKQTVLPEELVVTDDGSSDRTLAVVAAFAKTAPFPVRIIKNDKRLGYAGNFMKAAGLCQSDCIAFCDQDDVWLPRKLEKCRVAFAEPEVLLVYHDATVSDADLRPIGTLAHKAAPQAVNPPQTMLPWHYGLGLTLVFRRSLLTYLPYWAESHNPLDARRRESHDPWFFFLASCLGTIVYIGEPLLLYRQHASNTTGWGGGNSAGNMFVNVMADGITGIESRAVAAGKRASIMEQIAQDKDEKLATRARMAAKGYRKLEESFRERREIYTARNVFSRSFHLISLIRKGAYQPKENWGLGRKAVARDMFRGVLFPVKMETDK